jgi:hypothetical protein
VALTTLNQFSEIIFMLALTFCIPRFGLKNVLLIGMAAWSIRYFCFSVPYFETAIIGLLLHGFCYAFLYVAAYMYADKVAPENLKASAQSMMIFLLIGVGQLLGGFGYGKMYDANPPQFVGIKTELKLPEGVDELPKGFEITDSVILPIPAWSEADDSWFQYLDLTAQLNRMLGKEQEASTARVVDFGKLLGGQPLTRAAIDGLSQDQLVQDNLLVLKGTPCCDSNAPVDGKIGASARFIRDLQNAEDALSATVNVHYKKDDLKKLAAEIAGKDDFSLTRTDWLAAQAYDWTTIYRMPAIFIAICCLIFLLLGREPKENS